MKKNKAIFTICHLETFFLPRWINYYSEFFDAEDIYVILHNDNTKIDNVNSVYLNTNTLFDHRWLRDTVQDFQRKLLEQYNCVVFTEIDEFIYCEEESLDVRLNEFIKDSKCLFQTVKANDITHDIKNEPALSHDINDKIMQKRNHMVSRHKGKNFFDKTLITKIPLLYTFGFHGVIGHYPEKVKKTILYEPYNFKMLHLHKVDWNLALERHEERLDMKTSEGCGGEHNKRPLDMKHWLGRGNKPHRWEKIPDIVKERLKNL